MVSAREWQVRSVLIAALSSPYQHPKIAIAVDEDVNPHDAQSIWWAVSTRINPSKDVFVIPDTIGHANDSSLEVLPDYEGEGAFKSHAPTRPRSKLIIDATKSPSRWPSRIRDPFEHISPVGYHDIKLTDFIEE